MVATDATRDLRAISSIAGSSALPCRGKALRRRGSSGVHHEYATIRRGALSACAKVSRLRPRMSSSCPKARARCSGSDG